MSSLLVFGATKNTSKWKVSKIKESHLTIKELHKSHNWEKNGCVKNTTAIVSLTLHQSSTASKYNYVNINDV